MLSTRPDRNFNMPVLSLDGLCDSSPNKHNLYNTQEFSSSSQPPSSEDSQGLEMTSLLQGNLLSNEEDFDVDSFLKVFFWNESNPTQNPGSEENFDVTNDEIVSKNYTTQDYSNLKLPFEHGSFETNEVFSNASTSRGNTPSLDQSCTPTSYVPASEANGAATAAFQPLEDDMNFLEKFILGSPKKEELINNFNNNDILNCNNKDYKCPFDDKDLESILFSSPTKDVIETNKELMLAMESLKDEETIDTKENIPLITTSQVKNTVEPTINILPITNTSELLIPKKEIIQSEDVKPEIKSPIRPPPPPKEEFRVIVKSKSNLKNFVREKNKFSSPQFDVKNDVEIIDLTLSPTKNITSGNRKRSRQDDFDSKKKLTVFVCPKCYLIFPNKHQVRKHLLVEHNIIDFIECKRCDQVFLHKSQLFQHMHAIHANHECRECGAKFVTKAKWEQHIGEGHSDTNPFKCDACHLFFKKEIPYFNHLRTKHNKIVKFQCMKCHLSFSHRKSLSYHLRVDHNEMHACPKCFSTFSTPSKLLYHLNAEHSEDISSSNLKENITSQMAILPNKFSSFKCKLCGAAYRGQNSLEKHLISVHNIRPRKEYSPPGGGSAHYTCLFCPIDDQMCFTTLKDRSKHIRDVHKDMVITSSRQITKASVPAAKEPDMLICPLCCSTFRRKLALDTHYRKEHTNSFKCNRCPAVFYKESALRNHVTSKHLRRDRFPCTECKDSFVSSQSLYDHMNAVHFNCELYQCSHCKENFGLSSVLSEHMSLKHPNATVENIQPLFQVKVFTDNCTWVVPNPSVTKN